MWGIRCALDSWGTPSRGKYRYNVEQTPSSPSHLTDLTDMNGKCIVAEYVCFVVRRARYDYLRLWTPTPRPYIVRRGKLLRTAAPCDIPSDVALLMRDYRVRDRGVEMCAPEYDLRSASQRVRSASWWRWRNVPTKTVDGIRRFPQKEAVVTRRCVRSLRAKCLHLGTELIWRDVLSHARYDLCVCV